MSKGVLVIVRHGESVCNLEQVFAGWLDSELTTAGIEQARVAGYVIKDHCLRFDVAFSSSLVRARTTLREILKIVGDEDVDVQSSWRLNECHCGAYTGVSIDEISWRFELGEFTKWRNVYDARPPQMDKYNPQAPWKDPLYATADRDELPLGESLSDGWTRLKPFWETEIMKRVYNGARVLVVTHGNIMRAIRMSVESLSVPVGMKKRIVSNGCPLVYTFHGAELVSTEILRNNNAATEVI